MVIHQQKTNTKIELVAHMDLKNKQIINIIAIIAIIILLVACQNQKYNLSKEVSCFDLVIKVNENTNFLEDYNSYNTYHFTDSITGINITVGKEQYSTSIPEFNDMADKFYSDFNKEEESKIVEKDEDKIILINKKLTSKSTGEEKNYSIAALYYKDGTYYWTIAYGGFDTMYNNKDWCIKALQTIEID